MPVQFTILGSGSAGNCAFLEADGTRLLIDAGFSGRQIRQRLATISRAPEGLNGILITHEHSDHISGLVGLATKLDAPIYCNRLTKEAIQAQYSLKVEFRIFNTGSSFEIGDLSVDTFSIPHDAQDPVGFLIRTNCGNIGFLTDLGHATKLVLERVRSATALVLETNHDLKMLQEHPYRPWSLKQRIMSRHGHLSNEAAADAAEYVMSADLRHIFLAHLSSDCNHPDIAHRVMKEKMQKIGATHVRTELTSQTTPCATLHLSPLPTPVPQITPPLNWMPPGSLPAVPPPTPTPRPGELF